MTAEVTNSNLDTRISRGQQCTVAQLLEEFEVMELR